MPDLSKLPPHMTRPPSNFRRSHWLKTKKFIDAIYERDREEAIRQGKDPNKVVPMGRSTVHRAIMDLESDRIVGAFYWNGAWWIYKGNLLTFKH